MTDPGNRTRFIGRVFEADATLSSNDTLAVTPGEATTNAVEVQQIIFGDDCTVKVQVDSNGDGTYNRSVDVDTFTGSGISQGNEIRLTGSGMRLVVKNTGSSADFIVTGEEMAP